MDFALKFIDKDILVYIQDFSSYLFFECILSWYFVIITLICVAISLLVIIKFKTKIKTTAFYGLILALILSVVCQKTVALFTDEDHFLIGIAGIYSDGDNGELTITKNGKDLQHRVYRGVQNKIHRDVSTFSKLATPEVVEIEVPKSELSKHNIASIGSLFKNKKYNDKYSIIFFGTLTQNGDIQALQASLKDSDSSSDKSNNDLFSGYDDDYDILLTNVAKQMPINVLTDYIYAFVSQSLSVSASEHFKSTALGISLIDDSETVITKICESLQRKSKDSRLSRSIKRAKLNFKINKALIYSKSNDNDKSSREFLEAIKINLYYPYWSYDDFKKYYNKSYCAQVAKNTLKLYESDPDDKEAIAKAKILRSRLAYYDHSTDETLLDHFMSSILESNDFKSTVNLFKELSKYYPNESVVYLYWGDTLKYYKSEAFDLNLQFVDESIDKYHKAAELDRKWLLIPQKIYFTQFLRYSKEKNSAKAIQALKNAEKLSPSALGRDFEQYMEGL